MEDIGMQNVPQQGGQPVAPQQGGNLPAPNPEILSPIVAEHIDELERMREMMDGKIGDSYDRVLTAGMKMLYAPDNQEVMTQLIQDKEIPMANKLGEGVANLLIMMDNTGNNTIPKEIIVPVGVSLLFEAADYLFEIGIPVSEEELGNALEIMINGVFIGYGYDPSQLDKLVGDLGKKLGFEETASSEKAESPETEEAEGEEAFEAGFNSQPQLGGR